LLKGRRAQGSSCVLRGALPRTLGRRLPAAVALTVAALCAVAVPGHADDGLPTAPVLPPRDDTAYQAALDADAAQQAARTAPGAQELRDASAAAPRSNAVQARRMISTFSIDIAASMPQVSKAAAVVPPWYRPLRPPASRSSRTVDALDVLDPCGHIDTIRCSRGPKGSLVKSPVAPTLERPQGDRPAPVVMVPSSCICGHGP
jgi:hypothetical protein